jgi:hypothetical protein
MHRGSDSEAHIPEAYFRDVRLASQPLSEGHPREQAAPQAHRVAVGQVGACTPPAPRHTVTR